LLGGACTDTLCKVAAAMLYTHAACTGTSMHSPQLQPQKSSIGAAKQVTMPYLRIQLSRHIYAAATLCRSGYWSPRLILLESCCAALVISYHYVQGGCSPSPTAGGDFVADTPAVRAPNMVCKATDSCPTLPGNDLINNYMVRTVRSDT
jgi:hypothetical protein